MYLSKFKPAPNMNHYRYRAVEHPSVTRIDYSIVVHGLNNLIFLLVEANLHFLICPYPQSFAMS